MNLDEIESLIKIMTKHQVQEISVDGVKIVKVVHAAPTIRKRRGRPPKATSPATLALMQNTNPMDGVPEEVLYAVSGPPKNGYSNLKTSTILPNWNKASGE